MRLPGVGFATMPILFRPLEDVYAWLTIVILLVSPLFAQSNLHRSHILGLAHVAFRITDWRDARGFYEKSLGYAEPLLVSNESGNPEIGLVKVNEEQYIELLQGDARSQGLLDHFALYTDDLSALREYLLAQRVPVFRDIHQGRVGNPFLAIHDPDGHVLEMVQYSPTSVTGRSKGKFMPTDRVSNHISHIGILVRSEGSALKFYRDVLGFREISRGGGGGQQAWIDLQLPDAADYIELLPFADLPSPADMKAQNHLGLSTPDVRKTAASLQKTAAGANQIQLQTGNGLPPRVNVFDPDGVRIEIMEALRSETVRTAATHQ